MPRVRPPFRRWLRGAVRRHYARQLASRPPRIVWVLSHLRSGSTLLCHLLNGHPEICGFGETFTVYRGEADFVELAARIGRALRRPRLPEPYLLDKLLYGRLLAAPGLLDHPRVHRLFLIREPHGCLSSTSSRLVTADALEPGSPPYVAALLAHYRERLGELAAYAEGCADPRRSLVLTHHQLLHDTGAVFAALERFLGVGTGFSEAYPVLRTTGRAGGDRSALIRSGRLRRSYSRPPVALSGPELEAGRRAFESGRARLERVCLGVGELCAAPRPPGPAARRR